MARAKTAPVDPWVGYQRIQLTPEEKAAARAEAMQLAEDAARKGVYETLLALEGKVPLDLKFYERLREEGD